MRVDYKHDGIHIAPQNAVEHRYLETVLGTHRRGDICRGVRAEVITDVFYIVVSATPTIPQAKEIDGD